MVLLTVKALLQVKSVLSDLNDLTLYQSLRVLGITYHTITLSLTPVTPLESLKKRETFRPLPKMVKSKQSRDVPIWPLASSSSTPRLTCHALALNPNSVDDLGSLG